MTDALLTNLRNALCHSNGERWAAFDANDEIRFKYETWMGDRLRDAILHRTSTIGIIVMSDCR